MTRGRFSTSIRLEMFLLLISVQRVVTTFLIDDGAVCGSLKNDDIGVRIALSTKCHILNYKPIGSDT